MFKMLAYIAVLNSAITVAPTPASAEPPKVPRTIAVVKTWKDLEEQPVIQLNRDVKLQLGIEAAKAPLWSGVLAYCMSDGFPLPTGNSGNAEFFGPVWLTVTHEDGRPNNNHQAVAEAFAGVEGARHRALFMSPVAFHRKGKHSIKVWKDSHAKELLGEATVECVEEPFHPWLPLEHPLIKKGWSKRYTNLSDGIAYPFWYGMQPLVVSKALERGDGKSPENTALPTLLPKDVDPGLKLEWRGNKLILRSDAKLTHMEDLAGHILVRFWVNDKPLHSEKLEAARPLPGGPQHERVSRKLTLRLKLDLAELNARPGDKIGIQVLYSPFGWRFVSFNELYTAFGLFHADDPMLPRRLSNRVERMIRK